MNFTVVMKRVSSFASVTLRMMGAAASTAVKFANDHVVPSARENHTRWEASEPQSEGKITNSIHSALPDYLGMEDADLVEAGEDLEYLNAGIEDIIVDDVVQNARGIFALVAGSWMPYACVEEVGRKRQFITPAVETLEGATADAIAFLAFKEAGL